MLNLINELTSKLNINVDELGYQYLNLGGKYLYLIGYKQILTFTEERVVVKLVGRKEMVVTGSNLTIKEMDGDVLLLKGYILNVEVH